jgi:4-amino-4-deoxy-L-arabinose transferase-like glycosyltransferase
MPKFRFIFFSCVILLAAVVTRFVWLDVLPTGINRDEAALGYNAFLLQKTGLDEWGRKWPLALESFGDYKLPGYVWLTVTSFTLFGVSDWALRLPAALAGVLLVGLSYAFARQLNWSEKWSLVFAAILTFSPILIFYSRMAWEANVGLTLMVASLCLLVKKKPSWRSDALLLFLWLIAIFTYNTPLLLTPFVGVAAIGFRGLKNWKNWSRVIIGLVGVIIIGLSIFGPLTAQKRASL